MKMKKIFGVMLLGFMAVLLVACGQKSAEDIMKTELKDSYTGYSKEAGYEYPFSAGGDTLKFDKKNHVITNGANNENKFQVLSEKQVKELPSSFKGALDELENELKGTDNFTIAVGEFDKFEDKAFYPDEETLKHLEGYQQLGAKWLGIYNDLYLQMKMYRK